MENPDPALVDWAVELAKPLTDMWDEDLPAARHEALNRARGILVAIAGLAFDAAPGARDRLRAEAYERPRPGKALAPVEPSELANVAPAPYRLVFRKNAGVRSGSWDRVDARLRNGGRAHAHCAVCFDEGPDGWNNPRVLVGVFVPKEHHGQVATTVELELRERWRSCSPSRVPYSWRRGDVEEGDGDSELIGVRFATPADVPDQESQSVLVTLARLFHDAFEVVRSIDGASVDGAPRASPQLEEPPSASSSSPLIRHLATRGYVFDDLLIASFYGGLKAKGFVILSGLSGTGKTKLAQELATFLGPAARMLLVPVRPDWRDSSGLLGSWNPITRSYESTGFLHFVREAAKDWSNREAGHPRAHIVVLDEMNLSRVEYYFAELLSVLETGRDEEGFTREAITLPGPAEVGPSPLRLPPNLYLVGTVNMDETTFSFSPKVLDRAYTIELRDVDLRNYPPGRAGESPVEPAERERVARDLARGGRFTWFGKQDVAAWGLRRGHLVRALADLNGRLEPHDLHFGYRVVDEVLAFVAALDQTSACPMPERDAFDAAVAMKVLPKFHGTRHRLERPLQAVVDWAGPLYPATWRKADRMLTRARTLGHASFA